MAGMLQIITYLLAAYLVIKGIEVLQIGLSSNRENRTVVIMIGFATLAACTVMAYKFTAMQDYQASSIGCPSMKKSSLNPADEGNANSAQDAAKDADDAIKAAQESAGDGSKK